MSGGQVKNSMLVYFSMTRTSYLITGQVKILMYLPRGQVKIFRYFYPWIEHNLLSSPIIIPAMDFISGQLISLINTIHRILVQMVNKPQILFCDRVLLIHVVLFIIS